MSNHLLEGVLGENLKVGGVAIRELLNPDEIMVLLKAAIDHVKMSTGGLEPHVWIYPIVDENGVERGGVGQTIAQPLVESLMFGDNWPELAKCYFVLCSCRFFDVEELAKFLENTIRTKLDKPKAIVSSTGEFVLG